MALGTGLAGLKKAVHRASDNGGDFEKANWLKMDAGARLVFHFIQEIDADAPTYSEKNGLAATISEHSNPLDFRKKFMCTMADEGSCYGCELARSTPGWKAKLRFYANIVADGGTDVQILSQGLSGKAITPMLLEYAEEFGSITNHKFRIIRTGTGKTSTYSLDHRGEDKDFQPEDFTPYDLAKVGTRQVDYADQREFVGPLDAPAETASEDIW